MNSKDIWKKEYGIGLYDEMEDTLYFYCNKFKLVKKNIDLHDYFWDYNPDNMSTGNYINALKIFNYIQYHKNDAFGITPSNTKPVLIRLTPNDIDYFKIIF